MKIGDLVKIRIHSMKTGENWATGVILEWHSPLTVRVLCLDEVHLIGQSKLETIK
jgi:hypothetical protein